MSELYLLLGSNLGDRREHLALAEALITSKLGKITKTSSLYRTAAWGNRDQPYYLNKVIALDCSDRPDEVLTKIHHIEEQLGRERTGIWQPRTIDIDILYYGSLVIRTKDLKIPHPEIPNRLFTLTPLVEIAPFLLHPLRQVTQIQLLKECSDKLQVEKTELNTYKIQSDEI